MACYDATHCVRILRWGLWRSRLIAAEESYHGSVHDDDKSKHRTHDDRNGFEVGNFVSCVVAREYGSYLKEVLR
jgi:hypothetical protein